MKDRKHLLLYRNGTNTIKPEAADLWNGELAMQYTSNHEKLYFKNSNGKVQDFSADHIIHDRIDEQDTKMSSAIGLSASTLNADGKISYNYTPQHDLLKGFNSMNDSVEYLAGELQNCLSLIEGLKANVYMIETNFTVSPNTMLSRETVSFNITHNGNTTVPQSVIVKKSVNDGADKVIINTEGQYQASVSSDIEGAKERFTLIVQPDLTGSLPIKNELTRYLCYVGTSTNANSPLNNGETDFNSTTFTKYISNGDGFEANVTTNTGEYMWFCVPKGIRVFYVTSQGMSVSLEQNTVEISTSLGDYVCYRNYQALASNTWVLNISHKA